MTRGKPRISKFRPIPHSTSSNFTEDLGNSGLRNNDTAWNNHNGLMTSFGADNTHFRSMETSGLPYQPLYRDATGISLSMLSLDGNPGFGSTDENQDPMDSGPWLQPSSQDSSIESSNVRSISSNSAPKHVETTWQDMLPAGFPIPPPGRSKPIKAKTTLVKPRSKQIVQPVVSEKSLRSNGKRPARSDSSFRGYRLIGTMDSPDTQETSEAQNFQIRDFDKVSLYMREKLLLLQQQALKKVGKAWIKALCPKKQSRHPYSAKRKRDGTEQSPPWWPSIDVCPHKEPDHIASEHRINLLIHLLRLRPSPEDLDAWIGHSTEPKGPPALRAHEWTASLRDLTPLSIFDEITREPPHKVERRPQLLEDLFRIAQLEEEMMIGGNDGTDMIAWTPDSEAKSRPKRHTGEESLVVVGDRAASVVTMDLTPDYDGSSEETRRSAKRPKRDAAAPKAKQTTKSKTVGQKKKKKKALVVHTPSSSTTEELSERARDPFDPMARDVSTLDLSDRPMITSTNPSVTTSFGSNASTDSGWNTQWYEPRRVVEADDLAYHNIRYHHNPQINSAYDLTHPQFSATPGAQYFHGSNFNMLQHAASTQTQMHSPEEKPVWTMLSHGGSHPYDMLTPQMTAEPRQQGPGIPSNEAQPAAHMMDSGHWQPLTADLTAQFQAQHGHPYNDIANMHLAPAMLVHPNWHSQYHPDLQRPHGLPIQYDGGPSIAYVPPGPALSAQHHHFTR